MLKNGEEMRGFLSARWGSPEERKKAARRASVWAIPLPELKQSQVYQKLFLDFKIIDQILLENVPRDI
jgi:hypothetical protein